MKKLFVLICFMLSTSLNAAEMQNIGTINFENSGAQEAQEHFQRGVAILHSFGWKQAISEFRAAQRIDPDFAMAYWGESLCYNHPLIPEQDRASPTAALERLGKDLEERLQKAPTDREKGFVMAVEALFITKGSIAERRIAYKNEMQRLYSRYQDDEVSTFYALSLLSAAGASGDERMGMNVLAGSIAERVFRDNQNHPGAAHFVIHSFDDPLHAPLALDAAKKFANIAPLVSHARHMPSHIFIQHGMWKEVSTSNQSAFDAANELWEQGDSVGDMVHALGWGQYGDLQRADYKRARLWIERLNDIIDADNSTVRGGFPAALATVKARYIVESEQWKTVEVSSQSSTSTLLATGISAINMGKIKLAKKVENLLSAKVKNLKKKEKRAYARGPIPTEIALKEISALLSFSKGKESRALKFLAEGVALAAELRPPNGTPNPLKPVHELYAEVLFDMGRYEESMEMFASALKRRPNRPRSLLGLARVYVKLGNKAMASNYYSRVSKIWQAGEEDLTEVNLYLGAGL
ncbi:MAG: tetratricopeptide repeat protein [Pseudomonadales bacterium]